MVCVMVLFPDPGEHVGVMLLLAYLDCVVLFVGTREELLEAPMLQFALQ